MDINSINSNISTLNTSSSLNLEKISSSKSVNKVNEDSTNLYISDYNKKRDEFKIEFVLFEISIKSLFS